jgi:hypothetical protein
MTVVLIHVLPTGEGPHESSVPGNALTLVMSVEVAQTTRTTATPKCLMAYSECSRHDFRAGPVDGDITNWSLSFEISRGVGLGVNADLDFLATATLTPESNIADKALPTDSLTLKQKGEGVIRNSTAGTREAQVGVTWSSASAMVRLRQ